MAGSKYMQVTPQYKAMSLEDRMKHVALYKPEYEKQQDLYDKILEDTMVLEGLKGSDIDADLYNRYSSWRSKVEDAAERLSSTGRLDMQAIRDYRRQYLTDLKPMEDKYKHRNALIAQQAAKANPNTIYDKDYSKISVQDISLDDTIRSMDLSAIEKQTYEDITSKYIESGIPEDISGDIERIMSNIDTSGYSKADIERIKDSVSNGFLKASNAIDEYAMNKESRELQMALQRKSLRTPSGGGRGGGGSNSDTIVDSETNRKIKVYYKNGKIYTDKFYTNEYVPGESTITDIDRDNYSSLRGTYRYDINDEKYVSGATASGNGILLGSKEAYQDFVRTSGSEKAREAVNNFINEKNIDPYVMLASGQAFTIYDNGDQGVIIKIGNKPANAPAGN